MISDQTGNAVVHPRLLIHKEDGASAPPAPITFCEYADGADNIGGLALIPRVPTRVAAENAMDTRLSMGIGGSLDCGAGQTRPPSGVVDQIWVPVGSLSTAPAYYDVAATFTFSAQQP